MTEAQRVEPRGTRRIGRAAVLVALALAAAACTGDEEPELTVEQQLAAIEGRALTPTEVEERLTVAASLCRLDDRILDRLWRKLDDEQLEFQDFVFGRQCPERSVLYAGHTGRYVTEEAEQSGVVPSTTRPPTTTTATTPSTLTTTTIGPLPTPGVMPDTAETLPRIGPTSTDQG